MMDLFNIEGKRAIVTGGTRGLGLEIARGLLEAGCETVIAGTTDQALRQAEEFRSQGFLCHGVKGDLGVKAEAYRVFDESLAALGGDLDILVTSHGIQRRHQAEEFPLDEWNEVLAVNLTSIFILCQEAAKVFLPKGRGKIINIASMNSFFGGQTIPAYAASKGGVAQLTKALSNDWMSKGICVNAIAPGYMKTEMNRALLDPANPRYASITERIPAHRWGTGRDMVGAVIFLASAASDYVGGAVIPVDGGYLGK